MVSRAALILAASDAPANGIRPARRRKPPISVDPPRLPGSTADAVAFRENGSQTVNRSLNTLRPGDRDEEAILQWLPTGRGPADVVQESSVVGAANGATHQASSTR